VAMGRLCELGREGKDSRLLGERSWLCDEGPEAVQRQLHDLLRSLDLQVRRGWTTGNNNEEDMH